MALSDIQQLLLEIDAVSDWPEMVRLVNRPVKLVSRPVWEYPGVACEAVGGRPAEALPGAAAIFCRLASIHRVDDILDEEPGGEYHRLGAGRTANLALALQGAASEVVARAEVAPERRLAIERRLAKIALDTALGQEIDLEEITREEDYWRVVGAKTPPLFSGALYIGAEIGGASRETAEAVAGLGVLIGKIIQVSDDLKDALETPAGPDWRRRGNNLPILYATLAEHPDRARFDELCARIDEPSALVEAQEILVRSGAASYCVYQIVELYRAARERLDKIDLASPRPLAKLLFEPVAPVRGLLSAIGVEAPEELVPEEV